jgi:hypothetical protein
LKRLPNRISARLVREPTARTDFEDEEEVRFRSEERRRDILAESMVTRTTPQALSKDGATLFAARYLGRSRGFDFVIYACALSGGNETCARHEWGGSASPPHFHQVYPPSTSFRCAHRLSAATVAPPPPTSSARSQLSPNFLTQKHAAQIHPSAWRMRVCWMRPSEVDRGDEKLCRLPFRTVTTRLSLDVRMVSPSRAR